MDVYTEILRRLYVFLLQNKVVNSKNRHFGPTKDGWTDEGEGDI